MNADVRRSLVGSPGGSSACQLQSGWRSQFGHPRGVLGWFTGQLMAAKNQRRGEWVRGLLEARAEDRILEVGCGPGVDVAALSHRVGYVTGVDVSREMVRQARGRNAKAIALHRVLVEQASVEALPFESASFDKVFSINSVQFWPNVAAALGEVKRVLRPQGLLAIAIQPRSRGATALTSLRWEAKLRNAFAEAGFEDVHSALDERPSIPVVCCSGTKPGHTG